MDHQPHLGAETLEMQTLGIHPEPLSQNLHLTKSLGMVWEELPSGTMGQQVSENKKACVWEMAGKNVDPQSAQATEVKTHK